MVTAASGNTSVLPDPSVAAGLTDSQRVVSFAPLAQQNGVVTVTLTITDPIGASSQQTFQVNVTAVNDAPALTLGTLATHPAATTGVQSVRDSRMWTSARRMKTPRRRSMIS